MPKEKLIHLEFCDQDNNDRISPFFMHQICSCIIGSNITNHLRNSHKSSHYHSNLPQKAKLYLAKNSTQPIILFKTFLYCSFSLIISCGNSLSIVSFFFQLNTSSFQEHILAMCSGLFSCRLSLLPSCFQSLNPILTR